MTERAVAPLDQELARTALDELFALARKYNSSDAYLELMRFVGRFRFYSPFNAMLIYTQMPGAHFVCTARRWRKDYRREIKVSARPIVILRSARTSASCPARLGGSSDFRNMLDHFHCRFILFIHPAQSV